MLFFLKYKSQSNALVKLLPRNNIWLALVLLITTSACSAESAKEKAGADSLPYLKVVNVAADDHLVLRSGSTSKSDALAKLPPTTDYLLEIKREGNWVKVIYLGLQGWVYGKYVESSKTPSLTDSIGNASLTCLGTEPHWKLTVNNSKVAYGLYGESSIYYLAGDVSESLNRTDRWSFRASREGDQATSDAIQIILNKNNSCSDQMSDKKYTYDVEILNNDQELLSGCCH